MHRIDENCFLLIIDTGEYSGNFEREMVAYLTGSVGESNVSSEIAETAISDLEAAGIDLPDPLEFTDGLGTHWPDDADPAAVQAKYDEAVRNQAEETRRVYSHMPAYGEERAKAILERIGCAPNRWPAYQSVAVGFEEELEPSVLEVLVQRARDFCADPMKVGCRFVKNPIPFLGVRYVRHEITVTLHPLRSWT